MRRRSYALAVIIAVRRGWSINEESPAAAAAASRWPIFDFKEAHYTLGRFGDKLTPEVCADSPKALSAAPT